MKVFDKNGKEYKMELGKGCKSLEDFKKVCHDIPFDYAKVYKQLGGKDGSTNQITAEHAEIEPSASGGKGSKEKRSKDN
jgi:hypothetical protein